MFPLRVSCQDAQLKKTIRANNGNVYHNPYVGSGATDSSPHSLTACPYLESQNYRLLCRREHLVQPMRTLKPRDTKWLARDSLLSSEPAEGGTTSRCI